MTQPALPTARALAMFRDELVGYGFPPELIDDLLRIACATEIRSTNGLAVAAEPPPTN